MTGIAAIRAALESTQNLTAWFLDDLSDQDLLVRPVEGANHIAWQIGHLIQSEATLIREQLPDAVFPETPSGFADQHGKTTQSQEPPKGFLSKAQYLEWFMKTRQATLATVDTLSDADLDKATLGQMAQWAPTLGHFFLLICNHTMMHAGQFSVVRRKLGKPILF